MELTRSWRPYDTLSLEMQRKGHTRCCSRAPEAEPNPLELTCSRFTSGKPTTPSS